MDVHQYEFDSQQFQHSCELLRQDGKGSYEIIEYLHNEGVDSFDSALILSDFYKITAVEAQGLVFNHPLWNDDARANEVLRQSIVKSIKEKFKKYKLVKKDGSFLYDETIQIKK